MTQTRKKTREELKGRKLIKCPCCRELLMDLDRNEKVELFILPTRKWRHYEEVKVCDACKRKIGYTLTTTAAKN